MKVGLIGAGKVGFSLGKFLVEGGITVSGYYSRSRESAREAAAFTGTKLYHTIQEVIQENDVIFLTVPDGVISHVFDELRTYEISGKQICHCSGAMSAKEAFGALEQTGAFGYSIHPLFPISSKYTAYRELPGAFFCLEGEGPHLKKWKTILEQLGSKVEIIRGENKAKYHAACAISSNLMCALVEESLHLLEECGFSRELAGQALAPLMESNLQHLIQSGPVDALTGPLERGDIATVEKHLSCFLTKEEERMYRSCCGILLEIAQKKNPMRDYHRMEQLLKGACGKWQKEQ